MCENGLEYTDTVDPRVHVELERLNSATDEINKLEVEVDEARNAFRQLLCDSTARVDALRAKLGMCVDRAKPYYEARFCANEAFKQTQIAAMKFERANSAHSAAREMVFLAEQGLGGRTLDPAWQEMLNHATQRVNDAERERGTAGAEHRLACVKHEAANAKVQSLQKDLKRAIAKSSFSIKRDLMKMSSIVSQHELMLLPYYEAKAHFNHLLDQQKAKVQHYESQVQGAKMTYAEALRNLEQISDEIHQTRRKASLLVNAPANQGTAAGSAVTTSSTSLSAKQTSLDSNESFMDDAQELVDEYKSLPPTLDVSVSPDSASKMEEVDGYRNIRLHTDTSPEVSPMEIPSSCVTQSHSSEWTEINLDCSSPEDDVPYRKLNGAEEDAITAAAKSRLVRQKTLPNPRIDNEFAAIKSKMKLDANISSWISRSSAKNEDSSTNSSRRQSLDNILGPTSEKVKEIFSHGMMMLNISSLTERRNSEPKPNLLEEKSNKLSGGCTKKIPSPLGKTLTYLTAEEDSSDTESLSSVDMLNEEQINSLMLDKEIGNVCEQVLGTPISEIVSFSQCVPLHPSLVNETSHQQSK